MLNAIYAECHLCWVSQLIMPSVVVQNVDMLSVIILSVVAPDWSPARKGWTWIEVSERTERSRLSRPNFKKFYCIGHLKEI
jgi:hypothetical protein